MTGSLGAQQQVASWSGVVGFLVKLKNANQAVMEACVELLQPTALRATIINNGVRGRGRGSGASGH